MRTAEGASEKQSRLKARLRNGLTCLLTYFICSTTKHIAQQCNRIRRTRLSALTAALTKQENKIGLKVVVSRRLRSRTTSALLVPSTQRTTLGDRAFSVAAARAWNALPDSVRTSSSYMALRRQLKTLLFKASFGDDRT